MTAARLAPLLGLCSAFGGAFGCKGGDDGSAVVLPPEDTARTRDSTSGFPLDSLGDSGLDQSPDHTLTLEQWGEWDLSPFGGPYTALVGELRAWEYLDGLRPDTADTADTGGLRAEALTCAVTFSLVGEALDEGCPSCDFAFAVQLYLVDGDPADCRDPDMPTDGEVRAWGWSGADDTIWYDYGGSGLWLPWWPGIRAGDSVSFVWTATLGVAVDEEEEDE